MPKPPPRKWKYETYRRLVVATERVSNQDVSDVVDWAINELFTNKFRVWSGVHGAPGGSIQVEDEDFYEIDKRTLSLKRQQFRVKIYKMEYDTLPPVQMREHMRDANATVILAWCFSDGFVPTGFVP